MHPTAMYTGWDWARCLLWPGAGRGQPGRAVRRAHCDLDGTGAAGDGSQGCGI